MNGLARPEWATKDLVRPVRNNFVRIRVRRRTGAGLEDVDHEVLVEAAAFDVLGRPFDRVSEPGIQQAEFGVHECRPSLDLRQCPDEPAWKPELADREVLARALRAGAVVGGIRDGQLTHRITFDSGSLLAHRIHRSNRPKSRNL